jgi:hypothetical protein
MTTDIDVKTTTQTGRSAGRNLRGLGLAILAAAATAIYGSYGGASPSTSQEHAVPFIIGADIVVALLTFGLLVPWAARRVNRAAGWSLVLSVVGLIAIPIAFWSGVVIVTAGAGALLGAYARRMATDAGQSSALARSATIVGVIALITSTALLVLGNTVLA